MGFHADVLQARMSLGRMARDMATQRSRLLMLIDDEPAQGRLVSALAAREGWRTLTVATGEDALEMLASPGGGEVTAILLDQWVPGDQACELIRELPDAPAAESQATRYTAHHITEQQPHHSAATN